MWIVLGGLILLLLSGVSWARDAACGDELTLECYLLGQDPTQIPTSCGGPPKACYEIPEDQTLAQRDLVQQHPRKYLKVEDGLVLEKTPAEKDQVDAAEAALEAQRQEYQDETSASTGRNDLCNTPSMQALTDRITTLHNTIGDQITTQQTTIQGQIDAMATANLATLKQGLTALNNATATMGKQLNDRYAKAIEGLARCTVARRFVR